MRSKRDSLIRELAALFVKYSAKDWESVIALLRDGREELLPITQSIEALSRTKRKRVKRVKGREPRLPFKDGIDGNGTISRILDDLRAGTSQTSLAALRNLYLRTGGKDALPAKRDALFIKVAIHLSELPADALSDAIKSLKDEGGDLQQDYTRWVEMIYGDHARNK